MKYLISDGEQPIAKFRRKQDRDVCLEALQKEFPEHTFFPEDDD